jgi:cytochrome d ubiquinol oxidase subunit II
MTEFVPAAVMEPTVLQAVWFALIAVLIIGYFVLDGFDLGSGALYPFIAKNERDRMQIHRSIGPIWDGNEVWLLTAGGALFAAFAPAYATSFSGFYLAIMLVLFSLIARAIGLEFRARDRHWHGFYDGAFFLGSALPALLLGVAVGNIIQGLPLNAQGDYIGLPLVGLLGVFPLTCGLLSLSVMILQGASWQALKAPLGSDLRQRAVTVRAVFTVVVPVVFVVASGAYFLCTKHQLSAGVSEYLRYAALVLMVLVTVLVIAWGLMGGRWQDVTAQAIPQKAQAVQQNDLRTFLAVSFYPVALVMLSAGSLFPYLIPSWGPGPSISVASAGSSELSLTVMTVIACIGVPLVLVYHVISYRIFRGRLPEEDPAE